MRLLILTCSAQKRGDNRLIPASDRYDGPLWRVLRRYRRQQPRFAAELDVYVLSAAYGLIPDAQAIAWYEQTMTTERAHELRPGVIARFRTLMERPYTSLCLGLSQRYLQAMAGWEALVPPSIAVTHTDGPMGTKLKQLRTWLEGRPGAPGAETPARVAGRAEPRDTVTIAGVTVRVTRDEVMAQAQQALQNDSHGAARFRDWYVLIDGRPVAPKWLVSRLTGLPTNRFDASAARRVLRALGFDIEHVPRQTASE